MTFEFGGRVFNLLDTPGHEDFSEDTYRTLTAVDSAVMVIDAARGIDRANSPCTPDSITTNTSLTCSQPKLNQP